jgi:predicted DNA-binding protein (UPF0251 family)
MENRFLKYVDKTDTCWLWKGHVVGNYGQFRVIDKKCRAHRVAYELWVDSIPEGLLVRHKCDIPLCVKPEHLELGTHKDNSNDMVQRGRSYKVKGLSHHSSKLTADDINEIKILNGFDMSQREIANILNVSQVTISNAVKANELKWNKVSQSGVNNPNSKLSAQDILEIKRLRGLGFTQTELGLMYNIGQSGIGKVLKKI